MTAGGEEEGNVDSQHLSKHMHSTCDKIVIFFPTVPEFTQQPHAHAFDHDLAGDSGKTRAVAISNSGDE